MGLVHTWDTLRVLAFFSGGPGIVGGAAQTVDNLASAFAKCPFSGPAEEGKPANSSRIDVQGGGGRTED